MQAVDIAEFFKLVGYSGNESLIDAALSGKLRRSHTVLGFIEAAEEGEVHTFQPEAGELFVFILLYALGHGFGSGGETEITHKRPQVTGGFIFIKLFTHGVVSPFPQKMLTSQ